MGPAQIDATAISSAIPIQSNVSKIKDTINQMKVKLTNTLEGTKTKNSIAVLDGVRALAILTVVVYHSTDPGMRYMSGLNPHIIAFFFSGYAGVTLFLVLSGFLLFLPYIKSLLFGNAWPSVRLFYLRRALRIIPAYYISLFLFILLSQPIYLQPAHWKELFLFLTFFMDSAQSTFYQINSPFWTLAVEWQFYILLPWLALVMRPIVQRGSLTRRVWMLTFCLIGVIVWGITTRYYGFYILSHPTENFGVPHLVLKVAIALLYGTNGFSAIHGKFLEDFGVGMLAALCYVMAQHSSLTGQWNIILRRLSPWLFVGSIVWLVIMTQWAFGLLVTPSSNRFVVFLYGNAWIMFREFGFALGYGGLVLAVLFGGPILKHIFEWTPLRWIGIISFSMYIWHYPIKQQFTSVIAPLTQNWNPLQIFGLNLVWVMTASITFSLINFVLVEKPFMRISDSLRQNQQKKVKETPPPVPQAIVVAAYEK